MKTTLTAGAATVVLLDAKSQANDDEGGRQDQGLGPSGTQGSERTRKTPVVCEATPSMSGRTAYGITPTTGEAAIKSAAHHPTLRGIPSKSSQPIGHRDCPCQPQKRKRRPAARAALTGSSPAQVKRPGQEGGETVIEGSVDDHQGVRPAERPI